MYLSKDQILAGIGQRAERDEFVLALGGTVRIRELGRKEMRRAGEKGKDNVDLYHLAIVAAGLVDPDTKQPLFTFDELQPLTEGDDPPLRWLAVQNLAQAILDLSEVGPNFYDAGSSSSHLMTAEIPSTEASSTSSVDAPSKASRGRKKSSPT